MKISVIIPSRGRVRGLSAAITTLDMLASGKNEIRYGVCVDEDDPATRVYALGLAGSMPIDVLSGPRPESLGGLVNSMASYMPADVYCSLTDDVICLTPLWDERVRAAAEEMPHGVFFWKNALPQDSLFAVVTERWRAAAGGIFTNHYPYWFDDWALCELWTLATGLEPLRFGGELADRPRHTHRLRDLRFWQEFYQFQRHERVREAKRIAAALNLREPEHADEMARRLFDTLRPMEPEQIAQIERQGDAGEPDAAYLAAKARAEQMMREAA